MKRQGNPVLIHEGSPSSTLQRVHLDQKLFDEYWLQRLIHAHPLTLAVSEIEPGFSDLVPIAREVPCGHGYIDNLFLTPAGEIVVVEVKLWRNSQIRREVVAQLLDYISALTKMSYEEFEIAISRGEEAPGRLIDRVGEHPECLDEPDFIDAVSSNLARGRILAIVLGDGIRSETETLAAFLQSHAGSHFTFALVELAIWLCPNGDMMAVPNALAKTVMIERGVVRVENGAIAFQPPRKHAVASTRDQTEMVFWEMLEMTNAASPKLLQDFVAELEPLGVFTDFNKSLSIKMIRQADGKEINLGSFRKTGDITTEVIPGQVPETIWRPYLEELARLIDGTVSEGGKRIFVVNRGGKKMDIMEILPNHSLQWKRAIEALILKINPPDMN